MGEAGDGEDHRSRFHRDASALQRPHLRGPGVSPSRDEGVGAARRPVVPRAPGFGIIRFGIPERLEEAITPTSGNDRQAIEIAGVLFELYFQTRLEIVI